MNQSHSSIWREFNDVPHCKTKQENPQHASRTFTNPEILVLDIIIGSNEQNVKDAFQSRYIYLDSETKCTHICTTNKSNYFQNPEILLLDIIIGSDELNSKEAIQSRYIHLDSEAKHTHVQHIKVTMPVTKMSFSFHLPPRA